MYFDSDAPPDGFEAYPMASPAVYLADSIAVGLFLFLCCDDGAWMLGKIMKYKRKAKNSTLMCSGGPTRRSSMESSLRNTFLRAKLLQPAAGAISKSYLAHVCGRVR